MNKSIIILILIILYSCKAENKKESKSTEKENVEKLKVMDSADIKIDSVFVKEIKSEILDSTKKQIKFDLKYVKSRTSELNDKISISFNPASKNFNFIPKKFLEEYIKPHKIDIGFPEYLPADYPESYSFKGFKEYPKFDLFTFTYDDESCCRTLYLATTKKDTIEIINIGVIGYTGGDGGWVGEKYGEWLNENIIESVTVSQFDDDLIEENNNTEIDTTWSLIKLDQNGHLEELETEIVKYIGNKKIE